MPAPFVSFLIPSEGRSCLTNALASVYEQTDPDWNACVVFDGVPATMQATMRFSVIKADQKVGQGIKGTFAVRDMALNHMLYNNLLGKYIGFLDDDDTLGPYYVSFLKEINKSNPEADVVIFRMQFADGTSMPPLGKEILDLENAVGISFAIKSSIVKEGYFDIEASTGEDFQFLKSLHNKGFKFHISPKIAYFVNPIYVPKPDRDSYR